MAELKVEIPKLLEEDAERLERDVNELILSEEKRKLLSIFVDEVMKGAGQLSEPELIKLGKELKKGRFGKLKHMGLM